MGVLSQPDHDSNGDLHLVAYYSRKLAPSEINYEVHDKELLAVIESFRDMHHWLQGSPYPISVISDHKNLEYFMTSQVLNRRQVRWAMFLSNFNFHLVWSPGKANVADAPSCRPDFIPQKGDDHLLLQSKVLLTPHHTKFLLSSGSIALSAIFTSPNDLSALTTLMIDNSELLEHFKTAFANDNEWREAVIHGNNDFMTQGGLVFHKG